MMVVYLYYAMWSPLRLNINHSEGVFWTLTNHALLGYINDSVYVPTCFRHILLHEEGKTLQMPHKTRFKEKSCLKCDTY